MANSVDPDEMAYYEPSHLDLHCLLRHRYWSAGMKRLKGTNTLLGWGGWGIMCSEKGSILKAANSFLLG